MIPDEASYREVASYFAPKEWRKIPEYYKLAMTNKYVNYKKLVELGFNPRPPDYMIPKGPQPVHVQTSWLTIRSRGMRL